MTYFDSVLTSHGEARVLTKKRWWNVLARPHTSLLPADFQQLGRLGVVMYWSTSDSATLKTLHDSVVESLRASSLDNIRHAVDLARSGTSDVALALLVSIFRPPVTQYIKRIW